MKKYLIYCIAAVMCLFAGACGDDATTEQRDGAPFEVAFTWAAPGGEELWTRQEVTFTNHTKIPGTKAFEWDFGFEGATSTSTEENPVVIFPTAGELKVSLTVTGPDGTKVTASKTLTVLRSNDLPVASFTSTPEAPCSGDEVEFTDTSTDSDGTIATWAWNFGDTTTSSEQNPTHTYAAAGTYTVTLTVTDNLGDEGVSTVNLVVSEAPEAELAWSVKIASAGQINHGAVAVANGRAYAATTAGELVAVNLTTHQIDWRFDIRKDGANLGDPMNAPSVDTDGTVYFCSTSASNAPGPLYAIDGTTGIEKWKYEFGGGVRVEYCSPVISDDYIVIGNRGTNGSIVVINKADGTQKFRGAPTGGVGGNIVMMQNGTIISCSTGTNAFSVSTFLGGTWRIWDKSLNLYYGHYANGVQPAIDKAGRVYVAIQNKNTTGGSVGCFDLTAFDGATALQPLWQVDCNAQIKYSGCVLATDGTVYVVSQEDSGTGDKAGELLAIAVDGTKKWSWATGSKMLCVPAVDNVGNIHLADQGEGNYVIIDRDGNLVFKTKVCEKAHTSAVIDGDMVYLLGEKTKGGECYLYAYKQKSATGPAASDWPQYGQNARHTGMQAK